MEDFAVILDYLPYGYVKSKNNKFKNKPVAQAIGTEHLTLLELAPKKGVDLKIREKVYIGKGKREKIYRVLGKIDSENLTSISRSEINHVILEHVIDNEQKYVEFFNTAGGLTLTLHQLGLLPGINGSMVNNILNERKIKKFDSFNDLTNRVPSVKHPEINVADKIKEELGLTPSENKIRYLFINPPVKAKKTLK